MLFSIVYLYVSATSDVPNCTITEILLTVTRTLPSRTVRPYRVKSNGWNLSEVLRYTGTVNYAATLSGRPGPRSLPHEQNFVPVSHISCRAVIPPFYLREESEMNEPCWTQTIMFAPFLPRQQPKHLKRQGGSDFPDQTFTPHVLRDFEAMISL